MSATTNIINDGNNSNNQILESNVGNSASVSTLTNDGKLSIGNTTYPGSFSCDNTNLKSNGSGVLTCTSVNKLTVSGTATLPSTPNSTIGSNNIARYVVVTWVSTGGGEVITHNLGVNPSFIYVYVSSTSNGVSQYIGITAQSSTTFTAGNTISGITYIGICIG